MNLQDFVITTQHIFPVNMIKPEWNILFFASNDYFI